MTDPVSNVGRRAQSDPSVRSAMEKTDPKSAKPAVALDAVPAKPAAGSDAVQLSNISARAMGEPDFDRVKVESIKKAIQDGQYPLNPRRIAESFQALEQMISE
jgi:negative regulator of flagellin synthesis FlgM